MNIQLYAHRLEIDLYTEYSAKEASKLIRIGINALNEAANKNELPCIKTGVKKRVFLGLDLVQWKLSKRTELASTTLPKTGMDDGVEHGMTTRPSRESHQALALKTFQ